MIRAAAPRLCWPVSYLKNPGELKLELTETDFLLLLGVLAAWLLRHPKERETPRLPAGLVYLQSDAGVSSHQQSLQLRVGTTGGI